MRKNHANHVNAFAQVGLVAISPHGHLICPLRNPNSVIGGNVAPNPEYVIANNQEDTPLDQMMPSKDTDEEQGGGAIDNEGMDPVTARKVRELTLHKARAIVEEDYDLAKALKHQIEMLRQMGAQIAELETQKRNAVDAEDFDMAKAIKKEIEEIRNPGKHLNQMSMQQQGGANQSNPTTAGGIAGDGTHAYPLPMQRPGSNMSNMGGGSGWGAMSEAGATANPNQAGGGGGAGFSLDDRPAGVNSRAQGGADDRQSGTNSRAQGLR